MRPVDREKATRSIAAFLEALGYDSSRPELKETPDRVFEAFSTELLSGESVDLAELIARGSEPTNDCECGLVVVRDIDVTVICPHHLLPAVGRALVAYVPGERLLGLGTIARLVDACGRRLALQELVGNTVVDSLIDHGLARGAFCRLELLHTCLATRGAREPRARLVTVAQRGALAGEAGTRLLSVALSSSGVP